MRIKAKVEGVVEIEAEDNIDSLEIVDTMLCNMNFGELEDIDWEIIEN